MGTAEIHITFGELHKNKLLCKGYEHNYGKDCSILITENKG